MDPEKYTKLYPFTERGIQLRETHLKPANIADLAALAREVKWDPKTPFREILQKAQMHDDLGKAAAAEGDIELAFVQYAKAATLIFDEVPTRPDYLIGTNEQQKKALRDVCRCYPSLFVTKINSHSGCLEWSRHPIPIGGPETTGSREIRCLVKTLSGERDRSVGYGRILCQTCRSPPTT